MNIKNVYIKNFRGISELSTPIELSAFNIIIGDNGTAKTAILEAINFCLSPSYIASRLDINDFHSGNLGNIEITIDFDCSFNAELADGFTTQIVECNKVSLVAKKRDRAASNRAFSDLVTMTHYVVPLAPRNKDGWSQPRKNGTDFKFTERQLSLSSVETKLPNTFYFSKMRNKQLTTGYSSSLTNIVNDLNWRFDKSQREASDADHFKHERKRLHENVVRATGGETLKKTIDTANEILDQFEIDHIDISILKTLTPYDHTEIVFPFDGFELPVEDSGSGIEMTVAIALLESMAQISKEKIILMIDEPEMHLHPKLQSKLFEHLKDISANIQIISSTHSPILFKNVYQYPDVRLLISKKVNRLISIEDARTSGFGILKWSPSWGEICYLAYGLSTAEFHDDLYSTIEDNLKTTASQKISQADVEDWFVSKGQHKEIKWLNNSSISQEETLMTFVRNRIHHGDNLKRPMYTPAQLQDSIERMISLIKSS